jgi:hypothetical protein
VKEAGAMTMNAMTTDAKSDEARTRAAKCARHRPS